MSAYADRQPRRIKFSRNLIVDLIPDPEGLWVSIHCPTRRFRVRVPTTSRFFIPSQERALVAFLRQAGVVLRLGL